MVHGLRGEDDERATWLETLHVIRGTNPTSRPTPYDEVFDAIVELHRGRAEDAANHLAEYRQDNFFRALFRQWHAALAAEAAVLADHSDADAKIADAIAVTEHNPVAASLTRRARTLQDGRNEEFESIAVDLDSMGCPYQAARTLSLADGATAERGAARLRELGATNNRQR